MPWGWGVSFLLLETWEIQRGNHYKIYKLTNGEWENTPPGVWKFVEYTGYQGAGVTMERISPSYSRMHIYDTQTYRFDPVWENREEEHPI